MEQRLKDDAKKLIDKVGFRTLMKILMECSMPETERERAKLIEVLTDSLAAAIAWEGLFHVENHDGYECAQRIIDEYPQRILLPRINEVFCDLLQIAGKQAPVKSVNETTYKEIMKEINDG